MRKEKGLNRFRFGKNVINFSLCFFPPSSQFSLALRIHWIPSFESYEKGEEEGRRQEERSTKQVAPFVPLYHLRPLFTHFSFQVPAPATGKLSSTLIMRTGFYFSSIDADTISSFTILKENKCDNINSQHFIFIKRSINETAFNGFVLHRTINLHKWLNLSPATDMATACGKYQTAFVAHRQGDKVILVLQKIFIVFHLLVSHK
ncbi:hypothetical protein V1478_012534 [Vespula squamosa]|uniref:Uncharacterized protein n=1 Tax=Vespula squamosa TaxID=30214 RepID=A0ABD2ADI2_VESSQ